MKNLSAGGSIMNLKKIFISVALLTFVFAAFGLQNSSDYKVLFEKAKFTMETKGDLSGAIKLFEEIIQKYSDQRAYAAKSQYYIGLCFEKLGAKQAKLAQSAFQKVVDNYPEQAEAVKVANKKLSVLAISQTAVERGDTGVNIRQLLSGPDNLYDGWLGAVSPDGRYVSIVDWETGDLAIRDLTTGKKQRLTDQKNEKGYALYSRWSPDGKQIVYDWYQGKSFVDLRIIGIKEKRPHTIYKEYAWPIAWFPDGEHILIGIAKRQIAVLSTKNSTVHPIEKRLQGDSACVSPDGRYVAYSLRQGENDPGRDIYVYSIEEKREMPLIEHPANDAILGWSPDDRWVLFRSNRLGSRDAWIVSITDGKTQGNSILVKRGVEGSAMGFDKDGSFYFMSSKDMEDIYIASLDPETGEIQNPPTKMDLPFEGKNDFPAYSPDGKKLAYYCGLGGRFDYRSALHILSLESGKEKAFSLNMKALYPRWAPDGRTILVSGIMESRLTGIFWIDVQTGDVKPVLMPNASKNEEYRFSEWNPDGKSFFCIQGEKGKSNDLICRYDFETEKMKKIHQTSHSYANISLSPNGKWLAFIGREFERELKIIPADGGEPRVLYRFIQKGGAPIALTWSPDSQYVLFFKKSNVLGQETLCRMSVNGGEPQEMGLSMLDPDEPQVHPNGYEIVFSSEGFSIPYPEYWVMENFLPKEKSPRK
jgi:Tol biopolymer transport system component